MQPVTESMTEEKKENNRKGQKGSSRQESASLHETEGSSAIDPAELREWAEKAREYLGTATKTLREEARRRPELALGVALGVGFILGGGLSTRLGRLVLLGAVELGLKQTQAARSLLG